MKSGLKTGKFTDALLDLGWDLGIFGSLGLSSRFCLQMKFLSFFFNVVAV